MNQTTIWSNYPPLSPDAALLQEQTGPAYRVIFPASGESAARLADSQIAFGQPEPGAVLRSPGLKWIHLNTAGYTKFDTDEMRAALRERGAALTNSSSVYCEPCAQHVVAIMLAMSRKLPESLTNQFSKREWPAARVRANSVLLTGQKVLLVGFGAIGRRVAELLTPFHVDLIAVRKHPKGDEGIRIITTNQLNEFLPWADHVVNVLPASPSTEQLFNADRIALLKRSALFYNIGRGDTVDQTALRVALETESIAGAFLDVMMPEPLPPDDPLWTTPNCYISPHTAGGHTTEVERVIAHFVDNLRKFERKEPLRDRIV